MVNAALSTFGLGGWERAEWSGEIIWICQFWPVGWNCPNSKKKTKKTKEKHDNAEAVSRESRVSCALHLASHKSACTGLSALWPMLLSALTSVAHRRPGNL